MQASNRAITFFGARFPPDFTRTDRTVVLLPNSTTPCLKDTDFQLELFPVHPGLFSF